MKYVASFSHGAIQHEGTYHYPSSQPLKGGLFCPEIFGPVHWGHLPFDQLPIDARCHRWGHIPLAQPLPHPEDAAVELRDVPVLPPLYRRYSIVSETPTDRHVPQRSELTSRYQQFFLTNQRATRVADDPEYLDYLRPFAIQALKELFKSLRSANLPADVLRRAKAMESS